MCICEECKKTFTFTVGGSNGCKSAPDCMHHLVHVDPVVHDEENILHKEKLACSALGCSWTVHLEIRKPQLSLEHEARLLDRRPVEQRLRKCLAEDPARYGELNTREKKQRLLPAFYLQLYIRDVLDVKDPSQKPPRVSVRNKFYSVVFADEFDDIFRLMGFEMVTDGDEQKLQLPSVPDYGSTPYSSSSTRAMFEANRAHLNCLLLREPKPFPDYVQHHDGMDLPLAAQDLKTMMNANYDPITHLDSGKDCPDAAFKLLGVMKDMGDDLLWCAAVSQKQTHPKMRKEIYEALQAIDAYRGFCSMKLKKYFSTDEGFWFATEMSKEDMTSKVTWVATEKPSRNMILSKAYDQLDAQKTATDDDLLQGFNLKKGQWSIDGWMQNDDRHALFVIGEDRESSKLMQTAATFDSAPQATSYLGSYTESSTDPEVCEADWIAIRMANLKEEVWFHKTIAVAAFKTVAKACEERTPGTGARLEAFALALGAESPASTDMSVAGKVDLSLPAGLKNIRNTCYLNSILQYFNTIQPVRDVILNNWESYKLELTEENVSSRRLGGSATKLTDGGAFLAAQFVEEMRSLYVELQSSNKSYVTPTQRLALAALFNPRNLVQQHAENLKQQEAKYLAQPFVGPESSPALPPRPLSKSPAGAPTEPLVSVKNLHENSDTISEASSETLVDDKSYVTIPSAIPAKQRSALDDDDKEIAVGTEPARGRSATREGNGGSSMTGLDENETADSKSGDKEGAETPEQIQAALNDKTVTGTAQQDIEEVMGNILEHLHAAIKPTTTDEITGRQNDIILDTFYWLSKRYVFDLNLKTGQPENSAPRITTEFQRWMTAFPAAEGRTDIYAALDRSFDREHTSNSTKTSELYYSIAKAPPVLHIYIQRGTQRGRDCNTVEIPETLYLDRYMDGDVDSDVMKKRQRSWNLKGRLRALTDPPPRPISPADQANEIETKVQEPGYVTIDDNLDEFADAILCMDAGEGEGPDDFVSVLENDTRMMLEEVQLLPSVDHMDIDSSTSDAQEATLAKLDFAASRRVHASVEEEKTKVQEELSTLFTDMKTVAYRLHAVICHGGAGLTSGHYWVWIYDFQRNIWRKYNDETVSENSASTNIENDLRGNAPYYLAYVRESDIDQVVAITARSLQTQTAGSSDEKTGNGQTGTEENQPVEGSGGDGSTAAGAPVRHPLPGGHSDDLMQVDEDADVMHVEYRHD